MAAIVAEFLSVCHLDQVVAVWADFDHFSWCGPEGRVRVLDKDMIADGQGRQRVSGGVVEFDALLTCGLGAAFELFALSLPFFFE